MKRTFDQITPAPVNDLLYTPSQKQLKLNDQKIGDFIVKAIDAFHFKIVASALEINTNTGFFIAPKYLYWLFGEDEKIMGYEGLQVNIYLSAHQLVPYVEISWTEKAPAWTKIDDVLDKL